MKKITTKLLKILLVITISFTSIFNSITVKAMETIKSIMEENNIEKVYSTEFTSEEDAKNARLNEITTQENLKEEKSKNGISYLYYVSNLEQRKKTIPTTKEDFKETNTNYKSDNIIKTEEELNKAIEDLITEYKALEDENNIYEVTITSTNNTPVKTGTRFELVTYETLEEAVKATKETNLQYNVIEDVNEFVNNIPINEECQTKAECDNKSNELKNNKNYTNVEITINKKSKNPSTETITLDNFENKTFINDLEGATKYANELKEAISKYINDNEKDDDSQKIEITVNLDNILSNNKETTLDEQATNISGTYKTEDSAREAASNYINELKESNSKIDVEKSKENITINSNKVETVNVNELFEYRDDALEYFNNLTSNEYTYKNPVITAVEVSNDNNNNNGNNNNPTITNKTWWHLDIDSTSTIILIDKDGNYIDTVDGDILIKKATLNNSTSLSYPTDPFYDTNRKSWEFRSGDYMNLVKNGDQLKLEGEISYTYNNQTKTVPFSYTGQILSANNLCKMPDFGYDMSISGITIDTDDNAIVEVSKKYKLSYDKYNYTASVILAKNNTNYNITVPTITKTTTNYYYELVGTYTEKGYDYTVNYPIDIMEDRYSFEAIITHNSKPATKEIDIWTYYIQTMEIEEKGGDEENNSETKNETKEEITLLEAPKTGNKTNYINLLMIALLAIIKKIIK